MVPGHAEKITDSFSIDCATLYGFTLFTNSLSPLSTEHGFLLSVKSFEIGRVQNLLSGEKYGTTIITNHCLMKVS